MWWITPLRLTLLSLVCFACLAQEPPQIGIGTRLDPRLFRAVEYKGQQEVPKDSIVKVSFPPMLQRARCTASYEPQAKYPIEFQEGPNAQLTQVDGFVVKAHPGLTLKWYCWGIVRVKEGQ